MAHWTDLFDRRGFQARLAKRFSLSRQAVSAWRVTGIPIDRCMGVQEECNSEFRVWDFRPDDWHAVWPHLVGTKGAPRVEQKARA
jgi:hypothetical protein